MDSAQHCREQAAECLRLASRTRERCASDGATRANERGKRCGVWRRKAATFEQNALIPDSSLHLTGNLDRDWRRKSHAANLVGAARRTIQMFARSDGLRTDVLEL
jgi:hypothetical protein